MPWHRDKGNLGDHGLSFDAGKVELTFSAAGGPDVDIAQGVGVMGGSSFCYAKGSGGGIWTLNERSAGNGQAVTCTMNCV